VQGETVPALDATEVINLGYPIGMLGILCEGAD
jgi:hypothetical protein